MDLIRKLEQEEIARLDRKIHQFAPGDTVIVKMTGVEGWYFLQIFAISTEP